MPTEQRISEMATAATLDGSDLTMISQANAGSTSGYATAKTTLTAIGNKLNTEIQYAGLNTTSKTIVGAINEAAQSGGDLADLDDVNIDDNTLADGQVLKYDATNDEWINGTGGGGGGGTAIDYSTTEQNTGQKWIDGKDIWQRTYYTDNLSDTSTLSNAYTLGTLGDYDTIVSIEGAVSSTNRAGWSSLGGIGNITSWNFGVHITESSGNNIVCIFCASSTSSVAIKNGKAIVTIKYTKSTT